MVKYKKNSNFYHKVLPISLLFLTEKRRDGLSHTQKILFAFDIASSSTVTVLGILCVIQLGAGHHISSGLNAFSRLGSFASHGGMLATGCAWCASSVIAHIHLRRKVAHLWQEGSLRLQDLFRRQELLSSIDINQLPDPQKDNNQELIPKITYMVSEVERIYLQETGKPYEHENANSIKNFLNNPETFPAAQKDALGAVCKKYYNDFLEALTSGIGPFMQEIVTRHSTLFLQNASVSVNDSWVHFPHLLPKKPSTTRTLFDYDISQLYDTSQLCDIAVMCIETGTATYNRKKIVGNKQYDTDASIRSLGYLDRPLSLGYFVCSQLASEYKIHLMFKPEYISEGVEKLLEAIESNPKLRDVITTFKVLYDTRAMKDPNEKIPALVIYLHESKANAQIALDELLKFFRPYFSWGNGCCPRYNVNLGNPLVYYTQGDGHTKANLQREKPGVFNQLFEPDGAHYHDEFCHGMFKLKFDPA